VEDGAPFEPLGQLAGELFNGSFADEVEVGTGVPEDEVANRAAHDVEAARIAERIQDSPELREPLQHALGGFGGMSLVVRVAMVVPRVWDELRSPEPR